MNLLANELLSKLGSRIPTSEREVVKAIDHLGEPEPVVLARQARKYAVEAIYRERLDTELLNRLPEGSTMVPVSGSLREWAARQQGDVDAVAIVQKSSTGAVEAKVGNGYSYAVQITPEILNHVPKHLQRYLMRDRVMEVERSNSIEMFARLCMTTGGIFVLDPEIEEVLRCAFGGVEAQGLPPLPYPRIWIEAGDHPLIDLTADIPEGGTSTPEEAVVWGLAISELQRGYSWGVCAIRHRDWGFDVNNESIRNATHWFASPYYQRLDVSILATMPNHPSEVFAPPNTTRDDIEWKGSEQAMSSAVCGYALLCADIITARTSRLYETRLHRTQRKSMLRYAPVGVKTVPTVYRVSITTGAGDTKDETGKHLTCRFLVRGHWRTSTAKHAEWVEVKQAHCVWIPAFVKGPAGAPWKGRPVYVERTSTKDE